MGKKIGDILLLVFLFGLVFVQCTSEDGSSLSWIEARMRFEEYKLVFREMSVFDVLSVKHDREHVKIELLIKNMEIPTFMQQFKIESVKTLKSSEEIAQRIQQDKTENRDYSTIDWSAKSIEDPTFFDSFRPYEEINSYCDALASQFPNIVTKIEVGVTYEGAPIYGYYISTSSEPKPEIYLEALQHAREWLAPPTLIYSFYSLLNGYNSNNQSIVNLLEGLNWYIVPVVNIDGYKYTWTDAQDARYWRKNRHPLNSGFVGVDLNRNWGPADTWCTTGSSKFEGSETYCGEYPFSEPETRSVSEFVDKIPNLAGGIDYHTYGSLLLWPWQYTYDHIPNANYTTISLLGTAMVDAINFVNNQNFVSEQGSDLYPHSGGFIDYNFVTNNIIAYTLELRGSDFVVPPSYIIPSGAEAYQGLLTFANYLLNNA